jgi:peptidoglycan/xylan/chitin deacetylase (PgdA/CDA1 family)
MGETVNLSPAPPSSPSPRGGEGSRRVWRPGVALWLSAGFHIAALGTLFARPQWWPWILTAIVLNHVALALIGLWPRSRSLGANMLRLPAAAANRHEVALTFDDGPDPDVTPKVLDILDAHHAKASFFVIGDKAAACPALAREIVRRGHSIENHSRRHSSFFGFYAWSALRDDIGAAQEIVAGITGHAPAFFRSPMGIRNPLLDPVIARFGLRYITWTRRGFDTVARDPGVVLRRLTRDLAAGDILLLHDRSSRGRPALVLEVLPALLDRITAAGLTPVSLPMAMR